MRWVQNVYEAKQNQIPCRIPFNDVYEILPQKKEPVGGAARFAGALKTLASECGI